MKTGRFVFCSIAMGVAVLVAFSGVGQAAQAQAAPEQLQGSVKSGVIEAPGSPIFKIGLSLDFNTSISAVGGVENPFGGLFVGPTFSDLDVINAGGVSEAVLFDRGRDQTQKFGGLGTASDPFWISTTATVDEVEATQKLSYTLGSLAVQNEVTFVNRSDHARALQYGTVFGCNLDGDEGTMYIEPSSRVDCKSVDASRSFSMLAPSGDAIVLAGNNNGVMKAISMTDLQSPGGFANRCIEHETGDTFGREADCGSRFDDPVIAMLWGGQIPAGSSAIGNSRLLFQEYSRAHLRPALSAPEGQGALLAGEEASVSLSVANEGPGEAANPWVDIDLTEGLTLVSPEGSFSDGTLKLGGSLSADATQTIGMKLIADAPGDYSVRVRAAGSDAFDPGPCEANGSCGDSVVLTFESAGTGDAMDSTIVAADSTIVADGKSATALTVTARNSNGTAAGVGGADVKITATKGSVSETTDNGDGTYTATLKSSTVVGSASAGFTLGEELSPSTTVVQFIAGQVDLEHSDSSYTVTERERVVAKEPHVVTVKLVDAHANAVPGQASNLVASTVDDLGEGIGIGRFTESPVGSGLYKADISSTKAGPKSILVALDGLARPDVRGVGNTTALFSPASVSVVRSQIETAPGVVHANGKAEGVARVTLRDAFDNQVTEAPPGTRVSVTTSLGKSSAAALQADGSFLSKITATRSGDAQIRFAVNGLAGNSMATVRFALTDPPTIVSAVPKSVVGSGRVGELVVARNLGGAEVGRATVNEKGQFSIGLPSLRHGSKLTVVAVSRYGFESSPVTATVVGEAPNTPNLNTSNGKVVTGGTIEPESTLSFVGKEGERVPGTIVIDSEGRFTYVPKEPLTDSSEIYARVVGASGNSVETLVPVRAAQPTQPSVKPIVDGKDIEGCAEPGSTVTVYDEKGAVIGSGVAGEDCEFEILLTPAEKPGHSVTVTAQNRVGSVSDKVTVKVGMVQVLLRSSALAERSNQVVYGYGYQPGEKVSAVLDSSKKKVGAGRADANGNISFEFTLPSEAGLGKHTLTQTGHFSGSVRESFKIVADNVTVVHTRTRLSETGAASFGATMFGGALAVGAGLFLVGRRRKSR